MISPPLPISEYPKIFDFHVTNIVTITSLGSTQSIEIPILAPPVNTTGRAKRRMCVDQTTCYYKWSSGTENGANLTFTLKRVALASEVFNIAPSATIAHTTVSSVVTGADAGSFWQRATVVPIAPTKTIPAPNVVQDSDNTILVLEIRNAGANTFNGSAFVAVHFRDQNA